MRKYNIEKIFNEINYFHSLNNINYDIKQICLQLPNGITDWFVGTGRTTEPQNVEYSEKDFCNLIIPEDWEISKFIIENNLYRTRILKLHSKECYSLHRDKSDRLHLAITTNHKCFFVIDDSVIKIPADGNPYFLETTKYHTAINANLENFVRIHLVGCVYD